MAKVDAVFEGGGVKGIGLVGAVSEVEKAGYEFECLAGTSAGAIVAALLAVGYTAEELKAELERLDYQQFKDESVIDRFGIIGKGLSIGFEYGIYEGNYFEQWLETLLQAKGKTTFGDVKLTETGDPKYHYKLQIIATDLTERRLLVLPQALQDFGFLPEKFSIARAVRMSMSIPVFFEPVQLEDSTGHIHIIVDGGVLSNYPIWLLDDGTCDPPWPTFGFKLIEPDKRRLKGPENNPILNAWNFLTAIASTMMDAHDNYHISESKGDYERTIGISTRIAMEEGENVIKATDFDLSQEAGERLYQNGMEAATEFLRHWDFDAWKRTYRNLPACSEKK
ncbi:alpha/beta hydrolase [candidate division KSB3 bacterium]|uniref:Alpha/beta hydrolase n=1 Tax=candidate division KSB3 bacterium TaxID=2044937 RepID=A0A9D5JTF7_9BACT|nr:alpha/beta hydrolase [candidate division KSB3 bacterium]MBD3323691.1 alpha/beta hydrolase [candidate division KSB3 bacterium]